MMSLIHRGPQWVQHEDGWEVSNRDRHHIQYEKDGRTAVVEVDRGLGGTRAYTETLTWVAENGGTTEPEPAERDLVLARLVEGMAALGVALELFDG